ncbi:MAG: hypothetical protein U0931_13550 [Vulcanimicrobiota bacterium]
MLICQKKTESPEATSPAEPTKREKSLNFLTNAMGGAGGRGL